MQNAAQSRKNRMAAIRASMQDIPVIKKNSMTVQNKMARKKSLSLRLDADYDETKQREPFEISEEMPSLGKFQQKYQLTDKIGEGSNGFVKKCYCRSSKQLFAVKSISMDEEHIMFLKANFKYIKELNHPNIIKYHVMYLDNRKKTCYLVMDYDHNASLLQFNDLSEDEVREIMFQLLSTLAYIHSKSICHRDIKPENILYDRVGKKIKLIDFGISKKLQNRGYKKQMLTITGTLNYRAPQMFLGGGYDEKVDLWAAGVTMYQLLSHGKTPFQSEFLSNTIQNIIKGDVQYPSQIWNKYNKFAKDLISRLLRKRQDRLTAAEAKKHFWFQPEDDQIIDLTKSDNVKLAFGLKKQRISENLQQNYVFQRSLTNTFSNIQPGTESNNEKGSNEKGRNILKKWLAEGSDEDLINIQSQGEQGEESTPIKIQE